MTVNCERKMVKSEVDTLYVNYINLELLLNHVKKLIKKHGPDAVVTMMSSDFGAYVGVTALVPETNVQMERRIAQEERETNVQMQRRIAQEERAEKEQDERDQKEYERLTKKYKG